jgi:hypothetical protein
MVVIRYLMTPITLALDTSTRLTQPLVWRQRKTRDSGLLGKSNRAHGLRQAGVALPLCEIERQQ